MKQSKGFTVTLTVLNPIQFCSALEKNVLTLLRNNYKGRCYQGAFIIEILDVTAISSCRITPTNNSGNGTVDVSFAAEVEVISRWDIVTGVVISRRDIAVIGVANREDGAGKITVTLRPRHAETIRVDQKVAVRVTDVMHPPMQSMIVAVGNLLTCDQAAPIFRIKGSLDRDSAADLLSLIASIRTELEERERAMESQVGGFLFLRSLLYAFVKKSVSDGVDEAVTQGAARWRGPTRVESAETPVNFLEIAIRAAELRETVKVDGYWTRSLTLFRSSPYINRTSLTAQPAEGAIADATPRLMFAMLLKNMLDFLVAVREMVASYNTPELIEEHKNIWAVMRRDSAGQASAVAPRLGAFLGLAYIMECGIVD